MTTQVSTAPPDKKNENLHLVRVPTREPRTLTRSRQTLTHVSGGTLIEAK